MNREIKFRAWDSDPMLDVVIDSEEERMYSWDKLNELDRGGIIHLMDVLRGEEEFIAPMQFIGRYDKKDREIYEGDVVKCEGGTLPAEVVWFNGAWCLDTHDESTRNNPLEMYYFSDCEVIGNIYQNPELCQK